MTTYLFAGGGTAGHVNPMIAMADALAKRDATAEIIMLGTAEGLESRLVPQAGFELETIPKLPFPRRLNLDALTFPIRWQRAVRRVRRLIAARNVDVVIGVGGYASAPAYAAARAARIPIVIHEANARPGLANRLGARWSRFVGVAIAGTPLPHARLVGMPLRPEFESVAKAGERAALRTSFGLDPDRPTLVVTGGSLGARSINGSVSASAPELIEVGAQILHITGRQPAPIGSQNSRHVVIEYCNRMRDALACADLVISRAGSSTVSELAALGIPAVFVPYPVGNGEQRFNALPLVEAGGALIVADSSLTPAWIRENVIELFQNPDRLEAMGEASARLGIRDGRSRMLDLIDEAIATRGARSSSESLS
jgi:UDP-N-acetylglucosamine--N-acetylmuramyl-(pentapeptide) pyrophosphoryl-undecaprenol N-acetylglucosamine transferase